MDRNLGYLTTEYAREKMIESYNIEAKERKNKQAAARLRGVIDARQAECPQKAEAAERKP